MPTPVVVDLSHHNNVPGKKYDDYVANMEKAKASGIVGVIHKLTEGVTYTDPLCDNRMKYCQDAGLLFGVYHYLQPGNMEDQAAFFLGTAADLGLLISRPDTLFVCDYEEPAIELGDLVVFMESLEAALGRMPVLYSGHVLKDKLGGKPAPLALTRYKLWIPQYGPNVVLPPGWDKWWLWQFSDKGTIPGIDPPTDVNAYNGPVEQLVAEWSGEARPPRPEVMPTVEISVRATKGTLIVVNGVLISPLP